MGIPDLQFTPIEEIPTRVSTARKSFIEHKTRGVEFRLVQLRKLYWAIKDHEEEIVEACAQDLNKPRFETEVAESGWLLNDCVFATRNLHKWVKDEKAPDIDLTFKFMNPKIRKDPMGCVLVIGCVRESHASLILKLTINFLTSAFNFPFQLTLGPAIGAIAAGNTVVIKPSENAPRSAVVMQTIIESALDPSCYKIVQGGVSETQALLAERWDKIFFTGGANVGRIIAKAAAPNLTPVVLELGGINPAIVSKTADPRLVARRMLWGKTMNAGQVCTSQNYLLVDKELVPKVVNEFKKAYKEFFPKGAKDSPDYARIVNDSHFQRMKSMLDNTKGKILMGGTMDAKERFIEPTLVQVESVDDSLCTQESFGPFIPILPVQNLDEAIQLANGVQSTPLGLYPFGSQADVDKSKLPRIKPISLHSLTHGSSGGHPFGRSLLQRRRTAHPHTPIRRRGRKWLRRVPRPLQFRRVGASSACHLEPWLARVHPGHPVPAVRGQAEAVQGGQRPRAGL